MKTKFTSCEQPLGVTLDDLLEADVRGRWWIAGARWTGRRPEGQGEKDPIGGKGRREEAFANIRVNDIDASSDGLAAHSSSSSSVDLLRLAQAQRMNTDVRRQIFATIMSSSDYMDAFERVMKLNLKEKQEREIVYVLLTCCEDEPTYNPFYSHIAQKLCSALPHFKFTFQLAFWDRFKLLTGSTTSDAELSKMNHAARLLSFLLVRFSLSLAMLKVVDFGTDMPDDLIIFFHSVCTAMFSDPLCVGEDDDVGIERMDAGRQGPTFERIRKVFSRIGTSTEHQLVRSSMAYFLKAHVVDRLSRHIKRLKSGKKGSPNKRERKSEWLEAVLKRRRAKAALSCLDKVSIEFD
jgi:hypothetical protein